MDKNKQRNENTQATNRTTVKAMVNANADSRDKYTQHEYDVELGNEATPHKANGNGRSGSQSNKTNNGQQSARLIKK